MRCGRFRGGKGWGAIGFSGAVGGGGRRRIVMHGWSMDTRRAVAATARAVSVQSPRRYCGSAANGRGGRGKRKVFWGVFLGYVFVSGILPERRG